MTLELAKERFNYDRENGKLTYKISTSYKTPIGKEIGYIWHDGNKKYKYVKVCGKSYRVHRIIWLMEYGEMPDKQIDHINGNTLDNRINNLRCVDNITNSMNRSIQSNNTSGYHGINQLPSGNWRVRINVNRKRINVGTFESFDIALKARQDAEVKYGYHKNHGRENGSR